jgi:hypothetical protein
VLGQEHLEKTIDRVTAYRKEILEMAEDNVASILLKEQKLGLADQALETVRRAGDLLVAAFFNASKDKEREKLRKDYRDLFLPTLRGNLADLPKEISIVDNLRGGKLPVTPFHWEIEFPEVFARKNPGFDAFVGNPPFGGKNTVINSHREGYLPYLQVVHQESHGNSDLVAHFFRRAFNLLRKDGTFGLIATNTIAQGDTRATGLRWICTRGGTIYAARKRVKLPGRAAVVVSVVNVIKAIEAAPFDLDGRKVPIITAYLFHAGGNENAASLLANKGHSFVGSFILGLGFVFDDTDKKGASNTLSEMQRLIAKNPRNAERIFPYIGGEEVNESPTHAHHRYVIDFFDRSLDEASEWPDLLDVVRRKVKPERDVQKRDANRERWWQYAEKRPGLYTAIRGLKRVLVTSQVSKHRTFIFLPTTYVFDQKLIVFPLPKYEHFAVLQSNVHLFWSYFFGVTLEDRPVYTPSDCFETFPFPEGWESNPILEQAGHRYYEFRTALMVKSDRGLTATYNRFHDPEERDPEILKLRALHAGLDRAVLDAYGWTDIQPTCEFLLDYEEDEEAESSRLSRKKKPWRYRWPDQVRDEILARLLELNRMRSEEEQLSGAAAEANSKSRANRQPRKGKKNMAIGTGSLLDSLPEEGKS